MINVLKIVMLILFPIVLFTQTWTDPINISPNMPGLDNQPDLCIDKNGTLHCVFTHKLESNWRKIYYSKSTDDGTSWTTPEDISLNPDISLMNPHIIADTNNKLYVTYDYNTGNPAMTLIYLKTFDGNQWSEPFVVSEGMYNSDNNSIYVNYNNKLFVFWLYNNQLMYYRYFEYNTWSDTICPYPGDHVLMLLSAVTENNNIHCVGSFNDPGPPLIPNSIVYFSYNYFNNEWSDKTFISQNCDTGGGVDVDINNEYYPHISWHQRTIGSGIEDSTMYSWYYGINWSEPELIVNDPYEQKIVIDPYNRVHIFDREKLESGTKLVHYQKINDMWQGYIIDHSNIIVANPTIVEINNILYLVYYKCFAENDCKIRFTKNYLLTSSEQTETIVKEVNIYPNPFKTQTTIEFKTSNQRYIDISIYDLNGKHIKTIENKEFPPGKYKYKWLGTDKNRKEVKAGLYLVRLLTGRYVVTKPVELVK